MGYKINEYGAGATVNDGINAIERQQGIPVK